MGFIGVQHRGNMMEYEEDTNPDTYRNFDDKEIDYYLHVFGSAAREGDTVGIHCTHAAALVAMLERLKETLYK